MSAGAIAMFCGIVLLAAIVQGVSGFAFCMVVLMVFPYIFGYTKALVLSAFMAVFIMGANAWIYRKNIDWYWIPRWLAVYTLTDLVSVLILKRVGDQPIWYTLLGGIFILMAIYLLWGQRLMKVHINGRSMAVMATLSGLIMGAFGVGGPPMAAFFLEAAESKERYLGTSQFICFVMMSIDFAMRLFNGMFTVDLIGYSFAGLLFMVIGLLIAKRLVSRMNAMTMRKIVCAVMVVSGILMFSHG